jgi:hypothetical protein
MPRQYATRHGKVKLCAKVVCLGISPPDDAQPIEISRSRGARVPDQPLAVSKSGLGTARDAQLDRGNALDEAVAFDPRVDDVD